MTDLDDDIKDGDEAEGEHDELAEPNLADVADVADLETEDAHFPIGAPVATFDEDLSEEEDPHEAAFRVKSEDTHHLDPYGIGAPEGLEGDDVLGFEEEEEEEAFADIPEY